MAKKLVAFSDISYGLRAAAQRERDQEPAAPRAPSEKHSSRINVFTLDEASISIEIGADVALG
jgi:hypothetical protein